MVFILLLKNCCNAIFHELCKTFCELWISSFWHESFMGCHCLLNWSSKFDLISTYIIVLILFSVYNDVRLFLCLVTWRKFLWHWYQFVILSVCYCVCFSIISACCLLLWLSVDSHNNKLICLTWCVDLLLSATEWVHTLGDSVEIELKMDWQGCKQG